MHRNHQQGEGNRDSNQWFGDKEEIRIQAEQNKETRIQKNEERIRNLQETVNVPASE